MTEPFETLIRNSIQAAVMGAMAGEISEIVVKETRRALQAQEQELTTLVRAAVSAAIAEMLDGTGEK
jgi:hypothetical protein